ncbi:MAG: hypothetical protein EPN84_10000 [Legionella sp.]|nr:MAG: hypothetical protein EPN84_10000 [Legionella sp.]
MSKNDATENDDTTEDTSNLVFILAIAGRIDAQGRIFAKQLDKGREVYYLYAVLDSLSSSYSMFKYFFDMCIANNDSDLMHDTMLTPQGLAIISSETIFLVGFSLLACHFEKEEHDEIKKFIATAWPYFRDVLKALKNAYKGARSGIQVVAIISGADLNFLFVPVGLGLGIITALNRLWLRYMVEDRKGMMKMNAALLEQIKELPRLNPEEIENYILNKIHKQSTQSRIQAYMGVSISGLVDGLYLYVGVLGLSALSAPVFAIMATMCVFYTLACIVTRIYEEYDFQQRLFISQSKCNLALLDKGMATIYKTLIDRWDLRRSNLMQQRQEIEELEMELALLISRFDIARKLLDEQSTRTYFTATLLGLRNGLYAYGALASVLFLTGSILIMTSTAFPPALLIAGVSLGVIFILGFIIHSLRMHYLHLQKKQEVHVRPYDSLLEMKERLEKEREKAELLQEDQFKTSVRDGLLLDPSPQFFFQEWFEVIRSFFSGIVKGQKFVDFAGVSLQEADAQGHYHDTPVMYFLALLNSLFFAIVLALRALARGLGRAPLGQNSLVDEPTEKTASDSEVIVPSPKAIESPSVYDPLTELEIRPNSLNDADYEAGSWRKNVATSISRPLSSQSIFASSAASSPHLPTIHISQSSNNLHQDFSSAVNTIQGLN